MLKWGNSLAVRIPKHIAEEANLKAGDALEIDVESEGAVQLYRAAKTPSLARLVSEITSENRYEEISTGSEIGREAVDW